MKWRRVIVLIILIIILLAIVARLFHLHITNSSFLKKHGDARSIRVVKLAAPRGVITDRNNIPLAVTTPVVTVWVNPSKLNTKNPNWDKVIKLLKLNPLQIEVNLENKKASRFMYLKRAVNPNIAAEIKQLAVTGVHFQKEYRRFYPDGAASAQLIGFTNIDNKGQEGIELAYDNWLTGKSGKKTIARDLKGNIINVLGHGITQVPGKPIRLSIDRRIQAVAYEALKDSVDENKALAGSAVVVDIKTGEVLAMVNMPSFNPNNRSKIKAGATRNRVVTDSFEPGSMIKPFAVYTALAAGKFTADSIINTYPGRIKVSGGLVRDSRSYGDLTPEGILKKSSNVGVTKLVLALEPIEFPATLRKIGFGKSTNIGFPGEVSGRFPMRNRWRKFALATLSFGYGIAATSLQVAQAYAILANQGKKVPLTLLKREQQVVGEQVLNPEVSSQVLAMLKSVVKLGGTGVRARVSGYEVAGKTGTARKAVAGGYAADAYTAAFAGVIPADNPRLVMVVMIDDPRGNKYYGGSVAAPVFAKTMKAAVRILNI